MKKKYKFPDSLKIQLTGPDIENTLINLSRNGNNKEYIGSINLPSNEENIVKEYQLSLFKNDIETSLNHTVTVEGTPIDYPELPYVLFESDTDMTITPTFTNTGTLQYSIDTINWNNINSGGITSSSKKLYFRGIMDTNTLSQNSASNTWTINNGTNVKISGNINTLLNYNNPPIALDSCAFSYIFSYQNSITDISELKLPATTLASACYASMFHSCTGISSIPENFLPATILVESCYDAMFDGCSGLINIPENLLPATELAGYCYNNMFYGCAGLTSLPENLLPATILVESCYAGMFINCSYLTNIPDNLLPATILAEQCYHYMFSSCYSLTTIPSNLLHATILAEQCYDGMFQNCSFIIINIESSPGYSREFRIPTAGTGTIGSSSLNGMFMNTGGTMNSTPSINTTYYTKD